MGYPSYSDDRELEDMMADEGISDDEDSISWSDLKAKVKKTATEIFNKEVAEEKQGIPKISQKVCSKNGRHKVAFPSRSR